MSVHSLREDPPDNVIPHPHRDYRHQSEALFNRLVEVIVEESEGVTYYEALGVLEEMKRILPSLYCIEVTYEDA